MTQDEIIEYKYKMEINKFIRQVMEGKKPSELEGVLYYQDQIVEVAKLIAAKEREACAKTAEDKGLTWKSREDIEPDNAKRAYMASQFIAQAIRARGESDT